MASIPPNKPQNPLPPHRKYGQNRNVPPGTPQNPFPLPADARSGDNGPVGINRKEWQGHVEEWFNDHPDVLPEDLDADDRLRGIWTEIVAVTHLIVDTSFHDPMGTLSDLMRVRRDLGTIVARAGHIKNAVCLGLGSIDYRNFWTYNGRFVQQCGVFFAICQMIEEKQKMKVGTLPVIFQDPAFGREDRFVLNVIGGEAIVENPAANDYMNGQSFVYAPHFPANHLFDTILREGHEPELLYTNTFHGSLGTIGWAIADSYIRKGYLTGDATINQESTDMFNAATRFLTTHEGIVYWGNYAHEYKNPSLAKTLKQAFSRSSFYVRKAVPGIPGEPPKHLEPLN